MARALEGIRVVELTRNVAGPYAARLLAEFGAEVVKLEPPGGDPSRAFGPFPNDAPHPERSGLFLHLNRNKQSVVVDPRTAAGAATIRALAADADVLLEDREPGAAERFGWGYERLAAVNPRLVMTSITPFGQTGPYRDYRGSELTLQAIGGPLHANGHADREPLKLGGHFAHYHAGIAAATATLMALRRAEATGVGDWIDLSIYECQAACRDRRVINLTVASYTGLRCGRRATTAQRSLAFGVRRASDGYVDILAPIGRLPQLLEMLGEHDAARRIRSGESIDAVETARLEAVYDAWLAARPRADAVRLAQQHTLLSAPLATIKDVVDDAYYERRGVWDEIEHPHVGRLRYPGRPFRLFAAERVAPVRAPLLDEHGSKWRGVVAAPARRAAFVPNDRTLPLEGIRVAEITVVWAGPHVTQLLAEWGADVVRVEPVNRVQPFTRGMESVPTTREQAREQALVGINGYPDADPGADPWNRNASFNSHARNKRSMTADIMSAEGREAMLRLLRHCDVLVENNVPETIDKAGLDWETVHAANARLIMLRMPAFGIDGPYRNFRAFGLHVEAMIGHTLLRGYPDAGPESLSPSLASDAVSGVQGALAVLMALRHRERTGEGQLIELTLTEGFLPTLGEFVR